MRVDLCCSGMLLGRGSRVTQLPQSKIRDGEAERKASAAAVKIHRRKAIPQRTKGAHHSERSERHHLSRSHQRAHHSAKKLRSRKARSFLILTAYVSLNHKITLLKYLYRLAVLSVAGDLHIGGAYHKVNMNHGIVKTHFVEVLVL